MAQTRERLFNKLEQPDAERLAHWLGPDAYQVWQSLVEWIDDAYGGVFAPEWLFGGSKHGWGLRFKKSRAFCTLVPELGRVGVVVVLGGKERAAFEQQLSRWGASLRTLYAAAHTYHDGKWLLIHLPGEVTTDELHELLALKRKPRR